MFLFARDKPHSAKIYNFSIKLNGLALGCLRKTKLYDWVCFKSLFRFPNRTSFETAWENQEKKGFEIEINFQEIEKTLKTNNPTAVICRLRKIIDCAWATRAAAAAAAAPAAAVAVAAAAAVALLLLPLDVRVIYAVRQAYEGCQ